MGEGVRSTVEAADLLPQAEYRSQSIFPIRQTRYQRTLDYLFSQLPMFQRVGALAFKKDLGNIRKACAAMGNPQQQFKCIHIAGTNGKGSVAHFLAAVFTAAGFKTGLYTSPHYKDFRERVKIDGQLIAKKEVVRFVNEYQQVFEAIQPSFFEWTAALAFHHFAGEKVDMAIIETGLGGRLDSTNIVRPMLSIITNIGFDHMDMLGDTLPLIAGEKAGIIKPNTPVVIGETHPETAPVFLNKAASEQAPIHFADQIMQAKKIGQAEDHAWYEVTERERVVFPRLQLQHQGSYQQKNLVTTLQALHIFRDYYPEWFSDLPKAVEKGFSELRSLSRFIGRWDFISTRPRVLVDSAHNEDGIRQAMQNLHQITYDHLHFVLGVVSDKTHDKVFSQLPTNATYYFAKANIPRGLEATQLQQKAAVFGLRGKTYTSVNRALAAAKRKAGEQDLIFVGGSIFTVAEVL